MVLGSAGLATKTMAIDEEKVKVIKYLESKHELQCTSSQWRELSKDDKLHVVRTLNGSRSKSFNSWRTSFFKFKMFPLPVDY